MLNSRRRFLPLLLIPIVVFCIGIVGYMLIEGWSLTESFYMTAITLTTVGFGEVRPLTPLGRWFTIVLILLGAGSVAYGISTIGEYLLTSGVGERLRRRRMMNAVSKLRNHVIVCGYGRVGQSAVVALRESARAIVLVERDELRIQQALEDGLVLIEGDATSDEVLLAAGIEHAWGLIVCTGDDSVNLFIVLSARALNPKLFIITRSDADNEAKMRRAGADRVVSPYQIGGKHMANIAIRPHVTDFLDVVTLNGGIELWLEELVIHEDSPLVGQSVGEADIRRRTGVTLVAMLRHSNGGTVMPDANTRMEVGDELIVLGTREQLVALEELTRAGGGRREAGGVIRDA